jgi:hypothetical protein
MRVLILTHPRSGGMSLMKFIASELNYEFYHEPFFGNGDGLSDEDINSKLLVDNKIVVKDFPFRIKERGYNLDEVITNFDKVIIHQRHNQRDVAISSLYFDLTNGDKKMHQIYELDKEWIKNNENKINETIKNNLHLYQDLNDLKIDCLHTTYDGLFVDKFHITKLTDYLKICDPRYLDILNENRRLQNGNIGMINVKVKPKFI